MILQAFLRVVLSPVIWVLDALPTFSWPTWFDGCNGGAACAEEAIGRRIYEAGRWLAYLDGWVPVNRLFEGATLILAAWAFFVAVRVVRFLVSSFTGGGGAT